MYLVWCGHLFDGGEKRIDGGTVHAAMLLVVVFVVVQVVLGVKR